MISSNDLQGSLVSGKYGSLMLGERKQLKRLRLSYVSPAATTPRLG